MARAHGLRGEVAVRTFDPGSETLVAVERVVLRAALRRGARACGASRPAAPPRRPARRFEGVTSRAAAEALVGATVLVFREDLEPPAEGEFFQGDLVGLEARGRGGRAAGHGGRDLGHRRGAQPGHPRRRAARSWWCRSSTSSCPRWTSQARGARRPPVPEMAGVGSWPCGSAEILTLFPAMVSGYLGASILGKAREQGPARRHRHRHPRVRRGQAPRHRRRALRRRRGHGDEARAAGGRDRGRPRPRFPARKVLLMSPRGPASPRPRRASWRRHQPG